MSEKENREEIVNQVKATYSQELSEIRYRLNGMENGLITDLHPQSKMYGSLAHNVVELRKEINDLLYKIATDSEFLTTKANVKNHFDI
ncbi:hypothetical protein SAMN04489762_1055 [Terribacillus saccharophilus]|uniref:Uncharacterized protein n=1 Tax=Terribacillus saccharophilus TaxID=361277 RepID=A0AAX2ED28_9BACI|nr:hypothetical protein SAMN04489762_1055 [Terribacillus saccharophilus]